MNTKMEPLMHLLLFISSSLLNRETISPHIDRVRMRYMTQTYTVIFADSHTLTHSLAFQEVVKTFSSNTTVILFDSGHKLPRETNGLIPHPKNTVVFIDEKLREEHIKNMRDNQLWQARNRILVLVNNVDYVQHWLQALWGWTRAVNVVISTINEAQYFTWYPYQSSECTQVLTVSKIKFEDLFEEKVGDNLHNCTLHVSSHDISPQNNDPKKGLEMVVVAAVAEKLHMNAPTIAITRGANFLNPLTPDLKLIDEGFLKGLHENKVDIAFGVLHRRFDFSIYAEYVTSHVEDYLFWYVPPPPFLNSIEKFKRAFANETWVWISTMFMVTCTAFAAIKIVDSHVQSTMSDIILYTSVAYFNVPITIPKNNIYKFLFVVLYLYSMHITTMYQSGMMYMLSHKVTEVPLRVVEDAAERNYPFVLHHVMRELVNISSSKLWKVLDAKKLHHFTIDTDLDVIPPLSVGLAPPLLAEKRIQILNFYDSELRPKFVPLKKPFMSLPVVLFMSIGHPLVPKFDEIVQKLLEGGFCEHWVVKYLDKRPPPTIAQENNPLAMNDLLGIFEILGIVLAASIGIFIAEIVHHGIQNKNKKRTNNSKITSFIGRKFNSRSNILNIIKGKRMR